MGMVWDTCDWCNGTRGKYVYEKEFCGTCGGSGLSGMPYSNDPYCPSCRGSGGDYCNNWHNCQGCGGRGGFLIRVPDEPGYNPPPQPDPRTPIETPRQSNAKPSGQNGTKTPDEEAADLVIGFGAAAVFAVSFFYFDASLWMSILYACIAGFVITAGTQLKR